MIEKAWHVVNHRDGYHFHGEDGQVYLIEPYGGNFAGRVEYHKALRAQSPSYQSKLAAQALEYQAAEEARRQAEAAKAAARADRLALRARARIKIDPRMSVFSVASPALSRESKADIEVLHGLSAGVASIFEDAQSLRGTHDSSLTSELQYRGTSCE